MSMKLSTCCFLLFVAFATEGYSQFLGKQALPRENEPGQADYTALGCSDDRNCTALTYSLIDHKYHAQAERTTDGGLTWQLKPDILPPIGFESKRLTSIFCLDSLNIIAAGASGLIYRTFDGADRWVDQSFPSTAYAGEPFFLDSLHGLVPLGDSILQTTNAGTSWTTIKQLPSAYYAKVFATSLDRISAFNYGRGPIVHLRNGEVDTTGSLLFPSFGSGHRANVGNVFWLDSNNIVGCGYHQLPGQDPDFKGLANCLIVKSSDAGKTWKTVLDRATTVTKGLISFSSLRNGMLIAAGSGYGKGILVSSDWGETWSDHTIQFPKSYGHMFRVVLLDSMTALGFAEFDNIVLGRGYIIRISFTPASQVEFGERVIYGTHIYPNPTRNKINLLTTYTFDGHVTIADPLGRIAIETNIDPKPGTSEIDVSSLSSGVYALLIQYRGRTLVVGKFVIMKD
jgi:hypothetical protein